MTGEVVKYERMTEEQLKGLPLNQVIDIVHDYVVATIHDCRATHERVQARLKRMDALEKMGELYRSVR
jgi:hypothetical protein